jgi:hypothetical protein
VLTFLLLLFPNGHLASRRWRVVAWAAAVDLALVWVVAAFKPGPLEGLIGVSNPLGIQSVEAAFNLLGAVVAPVLGVLTILSAASIVVRFRRTRGVERQQLKWFTYAAVLSVLAWLFFALTGLQEQLPSALEYMVGAIFLAGVPVAIGIALLRYHLYDIDRLIRRTLVYGVLSALLGAVYAGTVLLLGQLFGGIGAEPPSWVVAGATLAVAALFGPARHRVQQVVDRRFNRRRYDAAKTIAGFSARLHDQVDLDTLTAELLAVVDQTVEPTKATLWLRPGGSRAAPSLGGWVGEPASYRLGGLGPLGSVVGAVGPWHCVPGPEHINPDSTWLRVPGNRCPLRGGLLNRRGRDRLAASAQPGRLAVRRGRAGVRHRGLHGRVRGLCGPHPPRVLPGPGGSLG